MDVSEVLYSSVKKIIKDDRKVVYTLVYYSLIEAFLVLSIPLASSFVINSVMSHAEISVYVLAFITIVLFSIVTLLQMIKEYIIEKFQQKIFVTTAIDVSLKATSASHSDKTEKGKMLKYMNYFFDITAIQKFFPLLLLDGLGIVIQIFVSLLLLWMFDPALFFAGFLFFTAYLLLLVLLGKNGFSLAVERSDAKHNAIYALQNISDNAEAVEDKMKKFDSQLMDYVFARQALFKILLRQKMLSFIAEGVVFSGFLIVGGYLVVEGVLPVGEFIAAEIVIVSITYALKGFIKKLDYIYDTIEGFYKVDKLTRSIGEK